MYPGNVEPGLFYSAFQKYALDRGDALLTQAADTDAAEDAQYGKGKRGDELPEELARRETRLAKLQKAKAEFHPSDKDPSLGAPELEQVARQCQFEPFAQVI